MCILSVVDYPNTQAVMFTVRVIDSKDMFVVTDSFKKVLIAWCGESVNQRHKVCLVDHQLILASK